MEKAVSNKVRGRAGAMHTVIVLGYLRRFWTVMKSISGAVSQNLASRLTSNG